MNPFELSRINSTSPYKVELRGEEYVFETDYDIRYAVWFEEQPLLQEIIKMYDEEIAMFRANKP